MKTPTSIIKNTHCVEFMWDFSDGFFDLAIIDCPYGIGQDGSTNHSREKLAKPKDYKGFYGADKNAPDQNYFDELFRVSKNQIIWGANHFIERINRNSSCWIVWDKDNTGDFADCELAWTSFSTAVRKFKYRWNGMLQENMKKKELRIHPTQKPVALYKWLLTNYAKQGDKILDTHLGSQSSRIAAHDLGFDFWGSEIDKHYFDQGSERFELHCKQMSLF